jgi:5-methylcytosine-specific restriction endonuclease McrA
MALALGGRVTARRRYFNPDRKPRSGWEKYAKDHPERAKFYSSPAWSFARTQQLMREPNCQAPGCDQPATHVDHILNRAEGGADLVAENLQSMCKEHHRRKTLDESHRGMKRAAKRVVARRTIGPPKPPVVG